MIKIKKESLNDANENEVEVVINNGDLQVLNSLIDSYGFKDGSSVIKFALGALVEGTNNEGLFTIKNTDGKKSISHINPSKGLLKDSVE
jgi:hypothetical protein